MSPLGESRVKTVGEEGLQSVEQQHLVELALAKSRPANKLLFPHSRLLFPIKLHA